MLCWRMPTSSARQPVAGIKAFGAGRVKGRLEQAEADAIASRITPVADLEGLSPCDLVVEAVTESEDLKNQIFATLDSVLAPHAILASNTSSIPITRMAAKTSRPSGLSACTL